MESVQKSWLNPTWVSVDGPPTGPVDLFGGVQEPTPQQLAALNDDTVYICSNWLAEEVAKRQPVLTVRTAAGDPKPKVAKTRLLRKDMDGTRVDQVRDHSLKRLLEDPAPGLTWPDLLKTIDTQLSVTGNAFVFKQREICRQERREQETCHVGSGLVRYLVPWRPTDVRLAKDEHGNVAGFRKGDRETVFYPLKDVIWFKLVDPVDPFGWGRGPVRGVYERILLGKNELAWINSLFRNQARPDSVGYIKDGTWEQCERLQKEFNQRFKQGGSGGVFFMPSGEMELKPLSWSPKDVLGVEMYKWTKLQIVNAFKLSPALFDTESSNRAVAETAKLQAEEYAVLPRIRLIEAKFNSDLCPDFDPRFKIELTKPEEPELKPRQDAPADGQDGNNKPDDKAKDKTDNQQNNPAGGK